MAALRRALPDTIAGQITGLVIIAVLLGVGLASGVLFYLVYPGSAGPNPEILASIRAARVAAIVKQAEASKSPRELERMLERTRSSSIEAEPVSLVGLEPAPNPDAHASPLMSAVANVLREDWGYAPLQRAGDRADADSIFLKVSDETALRFAMSPRGGPRNLVLIQTISAVAIITFIVLFLSIYAVRWITSPLSSIASAARAFGRPDAGDEVELVSGGPREIVEAATALNDMRKRVRALVNERTQMLVAISHDLRTPLTRLRLRVERMKDEPARASMLRDIVTVNDMLGETLDYVRQGNPSEQVAAVDLPSLLQTICAQFSDMGHDVSYHGPDRFAFACRAHALGRAVTNIVDNASKYGRRVDVALHVREETSVEIDVSDDGPGIPPALIEMVLEPFFKVDSARSADGRAGFGLGLSIARDIIEKQGGAIRLANGSPSGLVVRLSLRSQTITRPWEVASAA
jgi:signal transduction histidine kinase